MVTFSVETFEVPGSQALGIPKRRTTEQHHSTSTKKGYWLVRFLDTGFVDVAGSERQQVKA